MINVMKLQLCWKTINALNSSVVYEVKFNIFVLAIGLLHVESYEGFVEIFTF